VAPISGKEMWYVAAQPRVRCLSRVLSGVGCHVQEGNTALGIAVKRGKKDCVSVLMQYKADPNVFNKVRVFVRSPFGQGRYVVSSLTETNIHAPAQKGDTPLMIAAAKGRLAIAIILMQNEANSNLANSVRALHSVATTARPGHAHNNGTVVPFPTPSPIGAAVVARLAQVRSWLRLGRGKTAWRRC